MYDLSQKLINILNYNDIKYCHWKSNMLLDEALNGYDDLDLLVDIGDIEKFESLIKSLGFKEASNKNIEFNGIKHFYGLDSSGEILHLHIYYQIKTGPSWTKSLRFDFEDYILENLQYHKSGMPLPQKYIELAVFVFRVILKYSKINEFALVRKEKERTFKEIDFLLSGTDTEKLNMFLKDYFDMKSEEFFKLIEIIRSDNLLLKYITGKRISFKLKRYKYLGFFEENIKNIYQFCYRVLNKLLLKQKKKLSKGTFVVVAGLDATGKTTVTNDLKKWLGKNFTVRLVHFGKPPSAFITYPFNFAIKTMRKKADSSVKSSVRKNANTGSFLYVLRQMLLAYDRYKLAKKSFKKVSKGEIVISDRYKSENFGVMDSRRLDPERYSGLKRLLAVYENKLYEYMPKPDVVFYLTVPVEIAVKRNEERIKEDKESEEFIRIRHDENKNLKYKAKYFFEVDTNREYKDVLSGIKNRLWEIL